MRRLQSAETEDKPTALAAARQALAAAMALLDSLGATPQPANAEPMTRKLAKTGGMGAQFDGALKQVPSFKLGRQKAIARDVWDRWILSQATVPPAPVEPPDDVETETDPDRAMLRRMGVRLGRRTG